VVSVAESLPGVGKGTERHLLECAQCRSSVETIRNAIGALRADDDADAGRQAGFVDWTAFQSSVRERLLARSVRRDSVIRRWSGIRLAPRPRTAWALGALVVLSVLTVSGFRHFLVEPPALESASTASSGSWFMIDEPDALEVEAIAWAEADIFSTIDELNTGEEEVLRALILEATSPEDTDSRQ
jgi:hypothetical protein